MLSTLGSPPCSAKYVPFSGTGYCLDGSYEVSNERSEISMTENLLQQDTKANVDRIEVLARCIKDIKDTCEERNKMLLSHLKSSTAFMKTTASVVTILQHRILEQEQQIFELRQQISSLTNYPSGQDSIQHLHMAKATSTR